MDPTAGDEMRSWTRPLAWASLALIVALALVAILFQALSWEVGTPSTLFGPRGFVTAFGLVFGGAGALIASRRPANAIGWICLAAGFVAAINGVGEAYAIWALLGRGDRPPLAAWAAWTNEWMFLPWLGAVGVIAALFPEGRWRSRRWRNVIVMGCASTAIATVGHALVPRLIVFPNFENPIGLRGVDPDTYVEVVVGLAWTSGLLLIVGGAASAIARFRRSRGDERQQLKWLALAAALIAVMTTTFGVVTMVTGSLGVPPLALDWLEYLLAPSVFALPIAIAIAILKYRLYDIDVVINKTVVFGALAAFITAVYVAIVVGIGNALGQGDEPNLALSIAATAIVAVAFQPVRQRIQSFANRLVYGERATPYEVIASLSDHARATYSVDEVLPYIARIVSDGTGAARTDVWLALDGKLVPAASYPDAPYRPEPLALADGDLPDFDGADKAVAVSHHGELLGAITIIKKRGEPLTPVEAELLDDVASQAGLVLRNTRLTAELQARLEQISAQAQDIAASRRRIVATHDRERRRLERDIHDGAQQNLVALAVKLKLAKALATKNPERAQAMVAQLRNEIAAALETLRGLAHGIYPETLERQGLVAALQEQGGRVDFTVDISADSLSRYPREVEAAVYFSCLEALQNVAKYAHATRADVRLHEQDGELTFTVTDDGQGFDQGSVTYGSGLTNMADRLAAVGGSLEVTSEPGAGTTVRGRARVSTEAFAA